MNVDVIVTTCNFLEYTKLCVKSLLENTKIPRKLIFVDDASEDGTVEWLKTVPKAIVMENESGKRRGPWAGYNSAMDTYPADYYAFVDRDVIVTPNWLNNLISMISQYGKIGIAVPIMNVGPGEQGVPQGAGADPDNVVQQFLKVNRGAFLPTHITYGDVQRFGKLVEKKYRGIGVYNAPVWFHCAVIPHSTIIKVGKLDEAFFWCDGDVDYSYRTLKQKLYPAVRRDTYAHHLAGIVGKIWKGRAGHYGMHNSAVDWARKYPHMSQMMPEGRDWNCFLPHKKPFNLK